MIIKRFIEFREEFGVLSVRRIQMTNPVHAGADKMTTMLCL